MSKRLWSVEEFTFHKEKLNYYETIFTIGNGYLGIRGSFEEGFPGDLPTTLVHGVYNHAENTLVPDLVNIPGWLNVNISIDGTPFQLVNQNVTALQPKNGALLGYQRILDMQHGILRRELLFRAESGNIVRLAFERFASLSDIHVMAQRIEITAIDGEPEIVIESLLDGDVSNLGVKHLKPQMVLQADPGLIALEATTNQSGYRIALASSFVSPKPLSAETGTQKVVNRAQFRLNKDQQVIFDKLTAIYTSRDLENPLDAAREKAHEAATTGYETLRQAHKAEWDRYWEKSDIQIDGDEQLQLSVRFNIYHLLIAAPREDDQVSIGAKTLSGFGYKGHVFWDTELFILPPFTLTQPKLAQNLLMYRYHRLAGARNKAIANKNKGALFPWESTDTGEETTPQWSDPDPITGRRIRIWTGDTEQHISTDIAYAIDQFWRWTGDDEFLTNYGAEIILDTAVFWASRVEEKNDRYEISMQIGPDEYHENIDNSVFTNRMVVWHMQTALRTLTWLDQNAPAAATRLRDQLGIDQTLLDKWQDIIDRMFIPFDEHKQIHVQFPGFFDLEYIPVEKYTPRTLSVAAMLGHERQIQSQVIKQADVVMMMALLDRQLASDEVLMNNWNTYYPRTDHGSSLSPSIHAWVAARLGLDELAYELLQHAAGIDLNDNKGNVKDGIHGAACGGLWQAIIFGFCGLHIDTNNELAIEPRLPHDWKSVSFSVYYRGQRRPFTIKNPAYKSSIDD